MPSRNLSDCHITLQNQYTKAKKLFEEANKNVIVFLTCTYRTCEEQNKLFLQRPKVTNAKGGQSPHNYLPSFALDIAFKVNGQVSWDVKWFKAFSKYMISDKITWGGNWTWKDFPHFEITGWKNMIKK